ncbi:MAG: mannose-1-phosphate guanylyltransferase/mannose-6-phosphate isomerase [Pseudomonadota bacterium]|nr:mannose-1-phosphate guanylyltransferase/mannose-6-phosphate isomerase [Pseudomonadota bacterium]
MRIKPVILSGGSGTRLWPSSRKSLPKQFIDFPIIGSLFSRTLSRAAQISDAEQPLIISGKQHGFLCRQAASEAGIDAEFVLEETGRNTAPAIYFAALASRPKDILLVMPSDHWIEDVDAFANMVTQAATICADARWVTFGIAPTMAATGYGYIEVAAREDGVMDVASFTEKPDEATAETYISAGTYFWNSGIFMVRADTCLESFRRLQPALSAAADSCWAARTQHDAETVLPADRLEEIESISVDYAVMEREDGIALLPFAGSWSDVGNWDSLSALIGEGKPAMAGDSDSFLVDTSNTFVHTSGRTIAAVGVEDLIIVDDDNATLIARKGQTEKVKTVIDLLKDIGNATATEHSFEYRPWGMFENLLNATECKVKRLTVDPGQHLSLQYHHHRSEHWVVVSGVASVQLGEDKFTLSPGHSIDIPLGAQHCLGNDTDQPVIVIEVQMGSYFGEDDIVRVSDPYNR